MVRVSQASADRQIHSPEQQEQWLPLSYDHRALGRRDRFVVAPMHTELERADPLREGRLALQLDRVLAYSGRRSRNP